jgi:hypothetical protein
MLNIKFELNLEDTEKKLLARILEKNRINWRKH